ncbi:large subunit ribosomal protein L10Ae [Nematocida sp. LUAm3]|nr:large subunit ribosomal protein L10Ae [Nematocida sp. LUAm3]KAI5175141.1 large subunit ribosomal protein L10Ae [Nematocida sp. LUAm2]KAI5178187.1 large subunit ribosomal protein L10Ae [Nematocida sp. LUAm1]
MSSKLFTAEEVSASIKKIIEDVQPKRVEKGETIEVRIGLKGYDVARDKRFRGEVTLPYPKRKNEKVLVLADIALAKALEGTDIPFVLLENYKGKTKEDKKIRKKVVKSYHSFITVPAAYRIFEPALFAGKKKPVYMIKNMNEIKNFYEDVKRKIQLNLKADLLLGFAIGTSHMPVEEVAQNFATAMSTLLSLVKKGMQNIRSVYIKSMQGKPIRYY